MESCRQCAPVERCWIRTVVQGFGRTLHDLLVVSLMGLRRLEYMRVVVVRHLEVLLGRISDWGCARRNSTVSTYLKIGLLYIGLNILRYPLHVLLVRDHVRFQLMLGQVH